MLVCRRNTSTLLLVTAIHYYSTRCNNGNGNMHTQGNKRGIDAPHKLRLSRGN